MDMLYHAAILLSVLGTTVPSMDDVHRYLQRGHDDDAVTLLQDRIKQDKLLRDHVRLISLSFDRLNDTPETLKKYAANFRHKNFDWQFLTTPSDQALEQILSAYNQFVIEDVDDNGEKIGTLSHILRVYLIDQKRKIRNIYSVSFLHPDIIMNDILTIFNDHQTSDQRDASGDNALR